MTEAEAYGVPESVARLYPFIGGTVRTPASTSTPGATVGCPARATSEPPALESVWAATITDTPAAAATPASTRRFTTCPGIPAVRRR